RGLRSRSPCVELVSTDGLGRDQRTNHVCVCPPTRDPVQGGSACAERLARDQTDVGSGANVCVLTNGVSLLQTNKAIVLTGPIVMVMPFLHTGRKRAPLLPETEEPMTTIDFITALFYEVDDELPSTTHNPTRHLF